LRFRHMHTEACCGIMTLDYTLVFVKVMGSNRTFNFVMVAESTYIRGHLGLVDAVPFEHGMELFVGRSDIIFVAYHFIYIQDFFLILYNTCINQIVYKLMDTQVYITHV